MQRIQTLFAYLYAVFVDGGQRVLTIISIIGLIPIFFPDIAKSFGIQENISRNIGISIVVISFIIANYKLFESGRQTKPELILGRRSTSLKQFATVSNDDFIITDFIEVGFVMFFDTVNSEHSPTFVDFSIDSISSEWIPAIDLSKVEFMIDSQASHGNRLKIQGLESGEHRVEFTLKFNAPNDKTDFRYLGSLSKLIIVLKVKPQNSVGYKLPVKFDVVKIHNGMTEYLVRQGTGILNRKGLVPASVTDFVSVLKKYWGINDK